MILLSILAIMVVLLTVFVIVIGGSLGAIGIVVFGDVIIAIVGIVWLIKKIIDSRG